MGLIKAITGAAGGVLADQWKEFFYSDALPVDILVRKGQKRTSGRSSNTKGSDNIISDGSVIAVADGQCMLIVEQGKVVDVCAEPGEYIYDVSTEPSIFSGNLGESIVETFKNIGKRFTFGGEPPKDQRVYYFNTKEILGNKYGTASPVPFRVVDQRAAIDLDIGVSCFGEYSYKVINPIALYTNVCGNVESDYNRSALDSQMKSEFLAALQPAFAKISALGIRYSAVPGHIDDLTEILKEELSDLWRERRGIEICVIGMAGPKATPEDEQMIKEMQRNAAFMDPTRAAAHMVGAQAAAMQAAAANEGAGAPMAFMGMNMAQGAGGANAANLFQIGQQQQAAAPQAPQAPQAPAGGWGCGCGKQQNTGKFCADCGKPKPADNGWSCGCGASNKGKFCAECGKPKPAGVPQYKCDKCGWEPQPGKTAPKFCPECGDPFDNGDIK